MVTSKVKGYYIKVKGYFKDWKLLQILSINRTKGEMSNSCGREND